MHVHTPCRVLNIKCVADQSSKAFVQSNSQSKARLIFVTALEMEQLGLKIRQIKIALKETPTLKLRNKSSHDCYPGLRLCYSSLSDQRATLLIPKLGVKV